MLIEEMGLCEFEGYGAGERIFDIMVEEDHFSLSWKWVKH